MQTLNLQLEPMSQIVKERKQRVEKERLRAIKRASRTYNVGRIDRLNHSFGSLRISQRYETQRKLKDIRFRMRELARNSDHFKKFLSLVRNNVAGPYGMKLQVQGPDPTKNKEIEKAWSIWSHPEHASASGRLSLTAILRRLVTGCARDGESLVREIYTGRFGYSLRFVDVAWLDETFNETRGTQRVIMSVEIDENERPTNYYLTPPRELNQLTAHDRLRQRDPIPAREIHHVYLPDDENSIDDTLTRGIPWAHTAALSLFNLDQSDEAALYALRAGASKMGFFVQDKGDGTIGTDDDNEDTPHSALVSHFEPGTFEELPPGYRFEAFNPDTPTEGHTPFAKYLIRRVASGLDVSYTSLASDLEGVNLSSIRAGLLEERESWKAIQEFIVDSFLRPVYRNWLRAAVLNKQIKMNPQELLDYLEPKFQPKRWQLTEPLKEIQAKKIAIGIGLDTITDGLAEMGEDLDETFEKRANELKLADKLKIPLSMEPDTQLVAQLITEGDPPEDQPTPKKKATQK